MPTYSAEAIVLRRANFGEADQVVTLLTRFQGKIPAVAKGVRKMGSRKGGNLDLLNHIKAHLAEGKNMDLITEVDLISAFPVSPEIVKAWRFLLAAPLTDAPKLHLAPAVASRLQSSIQYYLEYVLERDLHSPELSRQVRKLSTS